MVPLRQCPLERRTMQLPHVGRSDHKGRPGSRRNKFSGAGQRSALHDGVISTLRRADAKAGHIRSLYHGPIGQNSTAAVSSLPLLRRSTGTGASRHRSLGGARDSAGRRRHRMGRRIRTVLHRAGIRAGDPGVAPDAARVRRGSRARVETAGAAASGESYRRAAIADRVRMAGDLPHRRAVQAKARRRPTPGNRTGRAPLRRSRGSDRAAGLRGNHRFQRKLVRGGRGDSGADLRRLPAGAEPHASRRPRIGRGSGSHPAPHRHRAAPPAHRPGSPCCSPAAAS